jgi:hypothetical protein
MCPYDTVVSFFFVPSGTVAFAAVEEAATTTAARQTSKRRFSRVVLYILAAFSWLLSVLVLTETADYMIITYDHHDRRVDSIEEEEALASSRFLSRQKEE